VSCACNNFFDSTLSFRLHVAIELTFSLGPDLSGFDVEESNRDRLELLLVQFPASTTINPLWEPQDSFASPKKSTPDFVRRKDLAGRDSYTHIPVKRGFVLAAAIDAWLLRGRPRHARRVVRRANGAAVSWNARGGD
jgi:hypothetical protein